MTGTDDLETLLPWIEKSLADNTNLLAEGYQGKTLRFIDKHTGVDIVIKTPHGRGLTRFIHLYMLRHEYRIYQALVGMAGVPRCYGMVANKYLVIEYLDAVSIRHRNPANNEEFYDVLLSRIQELHERSVAHMDLKKKDNLLVDKDFNPVIIDFGVAVTYKSGFHPINHFLYETAVKFDFNAWIKHKYMGRMDKINEDDMQYYQRTTLEKISRHIKRRYKSIKKFFA